MEAFAIVCSILAGLSAICAILTFLDNRKKDISKKGGDKSTLEFDVKYVKNGVDDLRIEVKNIASEQNKRDVLAARQDERISNIEKRLENIESELQERR